MEKQNSKNPHIKIFNEEIVSQNRTEKNEIMENPKHNSRKYGSGVFGLVIFFVGILLLLNNFGLVPREIWIYILPFWPVILILFGFKMLIGSSRIARFFYFIITFVLLIIIFMNALVHVRTKYFYDIGLPRVYVNFIN